MLIRPTGLTVLLTASVSLCYFPGGSVVKNLPAKAGDSLIPGSGRSPWGRKWQPTPLFLPGKSHRQRSLVGYSPRGCKRVRHDLATKQQYILVYSFVNFDNY